MRFVCVIPAFNEEACLEKTIRSLRSFFDTHFPQHHFTLVIADNGSTDKTAEIAQFLAREYPDVTQVRLKTPGKGLAICAAWQRVAADGYLFTDADLAYGTQVIGDMVEKLAQGEDVVVASRMIPGASRHQSEMRRFVTHGYNLLIHLLFRHRFTDAQAGCKGLSARAYKALMPNTDERGWFFDTHLLLEAERQGFMIFEIPTTNTDPRPRPPSLRVMFDLLYNAIALRVRWWIRPPSA